MLLSLAVLLAQASAEAAPFTFNQLINAIFVGLCALCVFFLRGIYKDFKRTMSYVAQHETDLIALDAALRAERRENRILRASVHDFRDFLASHYAKEWPAWAAKRRAERLAAPDDEDEPIIHRKRQAGDGE